MGVRSQRLSNEQRAQLHKSFHKLLAAYQAYALKCENVLRKVISGRTPIAGLQLLYTHSSVARTFFCCTVCLRTSAHLHACHIYAWLKGAKKVLVAHVSSLSPSRLLPSLMIHLSLLFLYGHLEVTTPDYDPADDPIHMILPYFPVLKAQDVRHSAPASRSLATWPNQMQNTGYELNEFDKITSVMTTRCSSTTRTTISLILEKHTRERRTVRCSHSV